MFDEPGEEPVDRVISPADRAKAKTDEFRMHAELAAVFEAVRKFDANLKTNLDRDLAREIQRGMAKLEKAKLPDSPVIPQPSLSQATDLLTMPQSKNLSTMDYHVHRRPGEVMIIRWLAGEEVETYYERLQAHFDAALGNFRQEERTSQEWKQDENTLAYLKLLDAVEVDMAQRYLRPQIRQHRIAVLSTQSTDEINIKYLTEYIMGVGTSDLVGSTSAPPDEAEDSELAWYFKLFSLRGIAQETERMCFFAYLQKTSDSFDFDE